jgi:hypothetical protein
MNVPAVALAAFGLGITLFAAMETEPEQIGRRALLGIAGLAIYVLGIMLL